jgi:hypothetical protein
MMVFRRRKLLPAFCLDYLVAVLCNEGDTLLFKHFRFVQVGVDQKRADIFIVNVPN